MQETIINRVAESGIITLNLEDYYPREEMVVFDLKEYLFMGLMLKEKDFRTALQSIEWQQYSGKNVALTCSSDAIIPVWAYMLVTTYLQPFAKEIFFGDAQTVTAQIMLHNLAQVSPESFTGKRVVIKGCGDIQLPESVYIEITKMLRPYAKSIMYGEPCSTVPLYKKK